MTEWIECEHCEGQGTWLNWADANYEECRHCHGWGMVEVQVEIAEDEPTVAWFEEQIA